MSDESTRRVFYLLVGGFSVYLFVECRRFLSQTDAFGLISPAFLATIFHFYLAFVISSVASHLDPWILGRFREHLGSETHTTLVNSLALVFLAAFCMWRGYDFARPQARRLRAWLQRQPSLRPTLAPARLPAILLQIVFIAVSLYAIRIGVFGVTGTNDARQDNIAVLELLNLLRSAGTLSLFLLLSLHYRRMSEGPRIRGLRAFVMLTVAIHVGFGAISGFKSQIVLLFIVMALRISSPTAMSASSTSQPRR